MPLSRLKASRLIGRFYRGLIVCEVCVVLLAAGANTYAPFVTYDGHAKSEVAKKSTRQKRIKRLKLADPESTEVMLA